MKDGSSSIRAGTDPVAVGSRTIELSGFGYTGQSEWSIDANGSWSAADYAKWDNAGGTPGMDGAASVADTALFGSAATAARTITLDGNNPGVSTLTFNNGTWGYTIAQGSGGTLTVGNATNAGTITNTAGNHTISAPITLGSNITMSSSEGSLLQISGVVAGESKNITKTGTGGLELSGGGNFGTLTISEGTLVINGTQTTTTTGTTIASGATLAGAGTLAGGTTISGTHSPGNSPDVQTFNDGLTYTTGASIVWELIDNTVAGRGTNYDGIDVTGDLTFSGSTTVNLDFALGTSAVDWTDAFWDISYTGTSGWKLFDVTGQISGFEELQLAYTGIDGQAQTLTSIRSSASFSLYQDGTGIYLNYTSAIPEPSTALAGMLLAAGILRRRRRA